MYGTRVRRFEKTDAGQGRVVLTAEGEESEITVDHAIIEIGGLVDYSPLQNFPDLELVEKYDNYRFQCHQMVTYPHNYESRQIANLYAGGYLAEGIGLVVIAMHGTTYAIAGDILGKEGRFG
jgi:hypothetical protein